MPKAEPAQRHFLLISGQVQGVGFRPFVYRLARAHALSGQVSNGPDGVRIEIQGSPQAIALFREALTRDLPPLARITGLREGILPLAPPSAGEGFRIVSSRAGAHQGHSVLVSPDMAVCDKCLHEMLSPGNRRYGYAFTNCTDCGPRYSITRSIPYDRPMTSMACFPLCPDCAQEYADPADRRFHAQPNACPVCGPDLWLEGGESPQPRGKAAILAALAALREGRIVAVKGLGGFHLACDARNQQAIARLRRRKLPIT